MTGSVGQDRRQEERGGEAAQDDGSWGLGLAEGRKEEWLREGNVKEEETWPYLKANRM